MKRLITVAALALGLGVCGNATILYVLTSAGNIYSVNTSSSDAAALVASGTSMNTLADVNGILYGFASGTNEELYDVSVSGGTVTSVAATTASGITALGADSSGDLWAVNTTTLYEYSLTGTLMHSYTLSGFSGTPGDLDWFNGTLYVTGGTTQTLYSLSYSGSTATATSVGTITPTQTVVGLANGLGQLYGFNTTQIFTLSTTGATAGATTLTAPFSGTIIDAADAIPEPATFGFIGVGLMALGGLAYRRRKA